MPAAARFVPWGSLADTGGNGRLSFSDIIWIFFIFSFLTPTIRQRWLEMARLRLMRDLERQRGSRLITMIYRQEALAFLGVPISRFINIEDSEQLLRAIRMTPDDMPIDILLHTPGGLVLAAEQIAHGIIRHKAKVTVFVPHYAMSGGTLIALAADEIVMDENAVLGPVDPQVGQYPAASVLRVLATKDRNEIDDETLILGDIAEKAQNQVRERVRAILVERMGEERAAQIAQVLTEGRWTHDYPITCEQLRDMGLPVCHPMPREIYQLMDLYPQPAHGRPSIQYVPVPYERREGAGEKRPS
jgi:ClpP class serine protease